MLLFAFCFFVFLFVCCRYKQKPQHMVKYQLSLPLKPSFEARGRAKMRLMILCDSEFNGLKLDESEARRFTQTNLVFNSKSAPAENRAKFPVPT